MAQLEQLEGVVTRLHGNHAARGGVPLIDGSVAGEVTHVTLEVSICEPSDTYFDCHALTEGAVVLRSGEITPSDEGAEVSLIGSPDDMATALERLTDDRNGRVGFRTSLWAGDQIVQNPSTAQSERRLLQDEPVFDPSLAGLEGVPLVDLTAWVRNFHLSDDGDRTNIYLEWALLFGI